MKTWMVTGCHDRRWLDNVVANYARQTRVDKHLIIVENGGGIGAALDCVALPGVVVLQSEPGPAQPLNAALAWLREHASPADWFCKADSDDYYGPGYLESIQPAIDEGLDYAGRSSLYIRTTEDRLWYVEGKGDSEARAITCYGLGTTITNFADARPGDFASYSTTPSGGHSVIFLGWLRDDAKDTNKITGFKVQPGQRIYVADPATEPLPPITTTSTNRMDPPAPTSMKVISVFMSVSHSDLE